MLRWTFLPLSSAGLTLMLLLADATPALAGPPWISVEYPANPHHGDTRGALMLVHTYRHSGPMHAPITGTAEGLVAGQRRSLPLQITPSARDGVYAVRGAIPKQGAWVLTLTMTDSAAGFRNHASALVALGPQQEIRSVNVPYELNDGWMVPRAATAGDVEEMLRLAGALGKAQQAVGLSRDRSRDGLPLSQAALGIALLLPLTLLRRRRKPVDGEGR